MDDSLKARALFILAEEMDLGRARKRLPHVSESQWRAFFEEAARLFSGRAEKKDSPSPPQPAVRPKGGPHPGRPVLFTDGASRGNPGPAAAGGVIYLGQDVIGEISEYLGETTNNQAEYRALILGLKKVLELGFTEVSIRTDSQLLARQIKGIYKVRDPGLKPLFAQVQALLKRLAAYDIVHVERALNREADALANRALNRRRA